MQGERVASLEWPFAAVGLVGGALCARAFGAHPLDLDEGGLAITVSTLLVAHRLGARLSASLGRPGRIGCWWPEALGRILLAGALNGLVILAAVAATGFWTTHGRDPEWLLAAFSGTAMAATFGALLAVPFVPSLLAVTAAHVRVGQARPGSLVERALRLRVWLAVAVVTALHVGLALHLGAGHPWRPLASTVVLEGAMLTALAAIPLLFLLLNRAAAEARAAGVDLARLRPLDLPADAPEPEPEGGFVDLGVGEARYVSLAPASGEVGPYREPPRPRLRLRGSPELALAALRDASWTDAVVLASALLPLGFLIGLTR